MVVEFTGHPFPVRVYISVGAAAFHETCKAFERRYPWGKYRGAVVTIKVGVYVMAFSARLHKLPAYEIAGVLAHESMHMWQAICEVSGEHRPGIETEAYMIQAMVEWAWKHVMKVDEDSC